MSRKRDTGAILRWKLLHAAECKGRCEACGDDGFPFGAGFLDAHHVLRVADGGTDDPWNLVLLCPSCHRRAHLMRYDVDMTRHRLIADLHKSTADKMRDLAWVARSRGDMTAYRSVLELSRDMDTSERAA